MADDVLRQGVRGISDIINIPGIINVDFADVKTVMSCRAWPSWASAQRHGEAAPSKPPRGHPSPLLEDVDIEGATRHPHQHHRRLRT